MSTTADPAAFIVYLRNLIDSGKISTVARDDLAEYSARLCEQPVRQAWGDDPTYPQVCELVRHHMLRTLIEAFERRNALQTKLVVVLAVAAIVAQVLPYIIAPNPMFGGTRAPTESAAEKGQGSGQHPAMTAPVPTQAQRPPSAPAMATLGSSAKR